MPDHPLTLGTAGHIDHGKTALVEALTGINTDRLAEERRRGISIELGFAELALGAGAISVVDVPGHERLVRTMVAGAGGIDLFLLALAADDGPMPQTFEHLAVLRALGIARGAVAVTRCDLVTAERAAAVADQARSLAPGLPVVETSARSGEGIEELRRVLAALAAEALEHRGPEGDWWEPAILHVDRVFTLTGIGTVVTGTLRSGAIAAGDRVRLEPGRREARVRSVQVHDRAVERAHAGGRAALNLARVGRDEVRRGDVVLSAEASLAPSFRLDAQLSLEPGRPPPTGERVQVHHGTRDVPARLVALDQRGLVQLRLERPLVARAGERLVIRSIAPPDTLGGGRVIDPNPPRHRGTKGAARAGLVGEGEPEALIRRAIGEQPGGVADDPLRWQGEPLLGPSLRRFSPQRWREAVASVVEGGRAARRGGRLLDPARVEERPSAEAAPVEPSKRALEVLELVRSDGLEPRAPQAIAEALGIDRDQALAALDELVAGDRAVRIRPGVYYPVGALQRVEARIVELANREQGISLAELRDELGTSRKYAQALLEWLDSRRVTIRRDDRHLLRRRG